MNSTFDFKEFCLDTGLPESKVVSVIGIGAYLTAEQMETLSGYFKALNLTSRTIKDWGAVSVKLKELIRKEASETIEGFRNIWNTHKTDLDEYSGDNEPFSEALWEFIQPVCNEAQSLTSLSDLHKKVTEMLCDNHEDLLREKMIAIVASKEEAKLLYESIYKGYEDTPHADKLIKKWAGYYGFTG